MAMRFLTVKLTKALLPLRASAGSRAFATAPKPKQDHPSTELGPAKYNSYEETVGNVIPQLREELRLSIEKEQKVNKLLRRIMALVAVGGPCSIAYVASTAKPKTA